MHIETTIHFVVIICLFKRAYRAGIITTVTKFFKVNQLSYTPEVNFTQIMTVYIKGGELHIYIESTQRGAREIKYMLDLST